MIEVKNLSKIFNKNKRNEVRAVDDISLKFPEKGLVAIYGASGSGKTTLMNSLGGLDKFDGGTINIDGNIYSKCVSDKYRIENIGYIFQNYLLDENLNVYQNVAQGLKTVGVEDNQLIFEKVMSALDKVGMRDYFNRNVTTLSGGQQQRVAIARAIVKGAKIILADEPTGNLDKNNTQNIMKILKSMSKDCLVILITHENDLIEKYADSFIELKDGKVVPFEEKVGLSLGSIDKKSDLSNDNLKIQSDEELKEYGQEKISFSKEQDNVVKNKKTGRVFSFGSSFASGVKSLFGKKKGRFTFTTVTVFILLIATLVGTGLLGLSYYQYNNFGEYIDHDLVIVKTTSGQQYKEVVDYIELKGYDIDYQYVWDSYLDFTVIVKGFESCPDLNATYSKFVFNDIKDTKNMKWLYGSSDNDLYGNVVISSGLADDVLKSWMGNTSDKGVGYGFLSNAIVLLNGRSIKVAGIVKEKDYKIYIDELYCMELYYKYAPDVRYGIEIADGEIYVPIDSVNYEEKTREIYGKSFKVVPSDKVTQDTINAKELREISQRYYSNQDLYIVSPQADELSRDIHNKGIANSVSSRVIDNEYIIYAANNRLHTKIVIDIILLAILLFMSFFMFKAALATKAKEIGLYRAIGVSTKNIVYKFFIEAFAFIVIPILLVYLLIGLPIMIFSTGQFLYLPVWLYFGSFAIVFLGMMLVSVLPILFYIRKTPVEILSKYDM